MKDDLQKSDSCGLKSERKKILTSSTCSLACLSTNLGAFCPKVVHLPSEKSILPYFSGPRGIAILDCDSHSQAGSTRAPFFFLLFLLFLISYYYYFHYFLFLIWFLANLSWAWSPIRVCLHHQGTVRSGNIRKLASLAMFNTSKFLSVNLGLRFGCWHRRKWSSCFLSLLFWSRMDEQYDDDI